MERISDIKCAVYILTRMHAHIQQVFKDTPEWNEISRLFSQTLASDTLQRVVSTFITAILCITMHLSTLSSQFFLLYLSLAHRFGFSTSGFWRTTGSPLL
jgi:hypothetical protein